MNRGQKLELTFVAGLALMLLAWKRKGQGGRVLIGPVTVTEEKVVYDGAETEAAVARLALAVKLSRQYMGADPYTLASRQPSPVEQTYIEETLALGRRLALASSGAVPYPTAEEQRFELAKKLPGDSLQRANAELYRLLGVTELGDVTFPTTAQTEARARQLIALWRPYSQEAVDTLFVLLDEAREMGQA